MKNRVQGVVLACILVALGVSALEAEYQFNTIDYPGSIDTIAYGIDGSNIVGWYSDGSCAHGFRYDGANWTTLDYPEANSSQYHTYAHGIDANTIVGKYSGSGRWYGFVASVESESIDSTSMPWVPLLLLDK